MKPLNHNKMKATELRIGNFVKAQPFEGMITVFNNDKCVIKHKSGIIKYFIEDLEPITLTEEWLLKFGFKKDVDNSFVLDSLAIFTDKRLKENVFIQTKTNRSFFHDWIVLNDLKLQHVHQLQNLYFALTNNELTFKSE